MRLLLSVCALLATVSSASGQITFSDGSQQSRAAVAFDRVIPVDADGTGTQNGTALLNTVAGITTASPSNQFFIQLDIGTYDLGSGNLTMKSNVHIGGIVMPVIGTSLSVITSSGAVTLNAADAADLTNVTLQNTGNASTVLKINAVDFAGQGIRALHLGAGSGTNIGVEIVSGGTADLVLSVILLDEVRTNGTNIGVAVSGTDSGFFGDTVLVIVGDPSAGNSTGVEVGTGARVDIGTLIINGGDTGDVDVGMSVASGSSCALMGCEFEDTTVALSNSGAVVAISCLFEGGRPNFDASGMSYVQCIDTDAAAGEGAPIKDTAIAVD